jgi:hypothetical protein
MAAQQGAKRFDLLSYALDLSYDRFRRRNGPRSFDVVSTIELSPIALQLLVPAEALAEFGRA